MIKRLAIIPARGNSKRIKNKNIKDFCGKPIIYYTLDTLIKTKLFKKIHVSTDSRKVKKICEKKIKIDFDRPKYLSGHRTSVMEVVKYVLKKYEKNGESFDEAWLVFPCSPLIEIKDYFNICKLIKKKINKTILTVSDFPSPVQRFYYLDKSNNLVPNNRKNFEKNSQDFLKTYYETGSIMAIPKNNFNKISSKPNLYKLYPYFLEKYKSIDVNTVSDWNFALTVYNSMRKKKKL